MKLRFANPVHLVDLNFISEHHTSGTGCAFRFGPLTRHTEIEKSASVARVPILHDCAAGIADVQVRNRGTIGGSLAEADPSGDWATVLLTLSCEVRCAVQSSDRTLKLTEFLKDAFTTALAPDELVSEVIVKVPPENSGGAYIAFKRTAPVYPTASAAVQLTWRVIAAKTLQSLWDASFAADSGSRRRSGTPWPANHSKAYRICRRCRARCRRSAIRYAGIADYKRHLVGALVKRATEAALRRARGQQVEVSHIYA